MIRCLTPLQNVCCTKSTGHGSLKDLESFSIKDLPQSYQHVEMFNLIKAVADLTVMVQLPYEHKECSFLQGTSKVEDVFSNTHQTRPCTCPGCKNSKTPSMLWGMVRIVTSANFISGNKDVSKYKYT
ncbi:hypothetical protein BgiBS90_003985 [Biomphalaria glabrata]|nr:hypothetical protein BgiBS90_003985 [Biomphalaria glabrata]